MEVRKNMKNKIIIKGLLIGIIILFIGVSIASGFNINSTTNYQPINRSWLYVGGSEPGNYSKIQDAINNASDGDTVFVYSHSSPYKENIAVNKSINLIGEDKNTTIIDGEKKDIVVYITADNVNIGMFTIENSSNISASGGIFAKSDSNFIFDNIIKDNYVGIFTNYSNNNKIINNNINYNHIGIEIDDSENNNISYNLITENSYGIFISSSSKIMIFNNTVIRCNIGIEVTYSKFIEIVKNVISESKPGYIIEIGIGIFSDGGTNIYQNFLFNNQYGIMYTGFLVGSGFIYLNNISYNENAISIVGILGVQVFYNDIWYNNNSIILFSCQAIITKNNIVSNSTIKLNSMFSFGLANNNYWGTSDFVNPRRFVRPPWALFLFFPWKSKPVDITPP